MPDYEAMYKKLFNAQTDAIRILQKAQQETEEIYISAPTPVLSEIVPIYEIDTAEKD